MRLVLVFFGLLFTFSVNAMSLTVSVINGWNSSPVANCSVSIRSNVGRFLEKSKTDSLGKVVFSDLTYGYHTLEVNSVGEDFTGQSSTFKLTKTQETTIILQPTSGYTSLRRTLEDEKYGPMNRKKKPDTTAVKESDSILKDTNHADTNEVWAEYPGGNAAMNQFFKDHLIYPELSQELGEQGRVYVQFIIEPDGVITHVSIVRGISSELDTEAKRLVRAMPKWNPGIVNGKAVRTRCRLPVTFTFN